MSISILVNTSYLVAAALFLLGLQKDFRSMRHFKGGVLEVAALKLEHGFRSGFLLGLLIILVLGVFVFCHF